MVTTSSCSGRVSVFLEGNKSETQIGAKGNEGNWLFVTHDPRDLDQWYDLVNFKYQPAKTMEGATRYILYKFEPLILHVKCRDLATANLLFSTAMSCGFRETGIGSNNIVGIRILIKLDIPIGYLDGEKYVSMVLKEYLEVITKLSHDRFTENFRKLHQLEEAIQGMGVAKVEKVETKDEKRERMRKEGMARREAVRAEKELKKLEKLKLEGSK